MAINSSIGSLHDDSDGLSSSQNSSQGPSYQSWSVDRINSLQSDVATTKLQLDHFKESTNTKISGLQTGFTGQISAIESKFDSKFDTFSREIRHSMSELKAELMQKMSELRAESKQNMLELTAESKQNMLELRAESKQNMSDIMNQVRQHEVQLVWRMFFAVSGILIFTISYLLIIYSLQALRLWQSAVQLQYSCGTIFLYRRFLMSSRFLYSRFLMSRGNEARR